MTPALRFLPPVAVAAVLGLAGLSRARPAPWLVNETPSLPRGLYVLTRERPAPGALVTVTPPAGARAYLARLGAPPQARLLKRVAAGPGEQVCYAGDRLTWPRGAVVPLTHDRQGRALPVWRGCRRLGRNELLVLGESPASFDGRYFGPVRSASVDGVYREVLRW